MTLKALLEASKALSAIRLGYWTELEQYPGVFLSAEGDMASNRSGKMRRLKGTRRGEYLALSAMPKGPYLHQEMCRLFHGPRPEGFQVRHLDGNRLNNAADNLAWGTPAENARDKQRHGTETTGERNPMAKLTTEQVSMMRHLRVSHGLTYRQIGYIFHVSTMTAYRAVEKQSWK